MSLRSRWFMFFIQVISYIILIFVLWITIERLLMWNIFDPFINNTIHILLGFFGFLRVQYQIDQEGITVWMSRFVIVVSAILLVFKNRYIRFREFWLSCLPFLALLTIAGISRFWSVQSGYTNGRYLYFAAVALGGFYIGLDSKKSTIRWIFEAFAALVVVGCVLMVAVRPIFAINSRNDWIGLFGWKMPPGTFMGFAAILFLFRLIDIKKEHWFVRIYSFVFYVASMFMLVRSQSTTELIAVLAVHVLVVLGLLYLKWGHLLKPFHWWIVGATCVIVLLFLWFGRGIWLGFLGKDSEFTGRFRLWATLIPYIKQRLFLGYGFGEAFWKNIQYYQPVWAVITWDPVFAHNGYIEALIDTGIVGLGLWIIFLVQVVYYSISYFLHGRNISTFLFFAWFVFVAVANIANNHLGSYETLTWLLLVVTFASLLKDRLEQKQLSSPKIRNALGSSFN